MNEQKSVKHKSKFWKIYIISIASFVCLMIAFFVLLSFVLSDYEDSLGVNEIGKIAEYVKAEKFDYILDNADVIKRGIETKENYAEALKSASKGKSITVGTAYSYDSENKPVFAIKADNEELFKVVLKKSKDESSFGFTKYEFDYITDFSFANIDVTFRIEDGMKAYINGKEIDDIFYAKDYFVSDVSDGTEIKQYEIRGLMSTPDIFNVKSEEYGDIEINNLIKNETKYLLNVDGENDLDVDIRSYEIFYWENKYHVDAKYDNKDDASIEYDVDNMKCAISHKTYYVLIPSNYTNISINGNSNIVLENHLVEENIMVEDLSNVPETFYSRPSYNRYKFSVKSGELEIRALNTNGDEVIFKYDDENLLYTSDFIVKENDTDQFNIYYETAANGAEKYAKFITNDLSFGPLAKEMVEGTVMYQTMNDYYKHSQYMYTDHDNTEFKNMETYDLKIYDKNCFSCAVHFEQWIYGQRDNPDFETTIITDIRIWFVNDNGKWKMADYELLDRK